MPSRTPANNLQSSRGPRTEYTHTNLRRSVVPRAAIGKRTSGLLNDFQRIYCASALTASLFIAGCSPAASGANNIPTWEKSVVKIIAGEGQGSGFIVNSAEGYIVTNAHVVQGLDTVKVQVQEGAGMVSHQADVVFQSDKLTDHVVVMNEKGEVQGVAKLSESYRLDLSIVRVRGGLKNPALPLAVKNPPKGDQVWALGYPANQHNDMKMGAGHGQSPTADLECTVTSGGINYFLSVATTLYLQHDAKLAPGNSGGPLINAEGEVVGVNTVLVYQRDDQGDAFNADNYSISSMEVAKLLSQHDIAFIDTGGFDTITRNGGIAAAFVLLALIAGGVQYLRREKPGTTIVRLEPVLPSERAVLVGVSGTHQGQEFSMNDGIRIGRDPRVCNLTVPADKTRISKSHAEVTYDAQSRIFRVRDTWSKHRTFYGNGSEIAPGQEASLRSGDTFYLSDRNCAYRVEVR